MKKLKSLAAIAFSTLVLAAPVLAQSSDDAAAGAAVGFIIFIWCFIILLAIGGLALNIYFTVDALNRDYGDDENMKLIGLLVLWLLYLGGLPFIGWIVYYFMVMNKYPKVEKASK